MLYPSMLDIKLHMLMEHPSLVYNLRGKALQVALSDFTDSVDHTGGDVVWVLDFLAFALGRG